MKLRMKELRLKRHMTQRQVAEIAGMSVSYYTELEGGKKTINANRMVSIAKALGVQPQDLIVGGSDAEKDELLGMLKTLPEDKQRLVYEMVVSLAEARRQAS